MTPTGHSTDSPQDFGLKALHLITQIWQVDDSRIIWSGSGFEWWPGDFRVRGRASRVVAEGEARWRLSIQTDFLTNVPVRSKNFAQRVAVLSSASFSSYAWVYPCGPSSLAEADRADLWFGGTAYITEETLEDYSHLFACLAIMQPIDAQKFAEAAAALLGGEPHRSCPNQGDGRAQLDDVLNLADAWYVPAGQDVSRWLGTDEFEEINSLIGRCDWAFGFAGETGLSMETPFGSDSALVRLQTDQPSHRLGHGLLSTVQFMVPPVGLAKSPAEGCAVLNFWESSFLTGFSMLGGWILDPSGTQPAFASFIPNALFTGGIATNFTLWQMARVRLVRNTFRPELADKAMAEILMNRFGPEILGTSEASPNAPKTH